jgi:hypothetical protein
LEEALAAAMENVSIAADTGAGAGEATGQDDGSGSAGTQMNGYVRLERFSLAAQASYSHCHRIRFQCRTIKDQSVGPKRYSALRGNGKKAVRCA